jgi:hypothetical protein
VAGDIIQALIFDKRTREHQVRTEHDCPLAAVLRALDRCMRGQDDRFIRIHLLQPGTDQLTNTLLDCAQGFRRIGGAQLQLGAQARARQPGHRQDLRFQPFELTGFNESGFINHPYVRYL